MGKMLGLLDVHPISEEVSVGKDQIVHVTGLSGEIIWKLMAKYPNLFAMLANSGGQPQNMDPNVLADLVAASTRGFEDEQVILRARELPVAAQMKIIMAMGRVTFPDGFGPFLEDLRSMSTSANEAVEVVIKASATISQKQPKPSEQPPTPPSGN